MALADILQYIDNQQRFYVDQLKEFVLNGASGTEIKREAIRGGMVTLRRSALNMMLQGVTTISEVFRVSTSDAN